MKKHALIVAALAMVLLSACNKEPFPGTSPGITKVQEILPYAKAFISAGRERGVEIPDDLNGITFKVAKIKGGAIGICYYDPANPGHITVDERYWRGASTTNDDRELLVFHELGHCFLNRDHDDSVLSSGLCKSVMHADESNCDTEYGSNRKRLLDELFSTGIIP